MRVRAGLDGLVPEGRFQPGQPCTPRTMHTAGHQFHTKKVRRLVPSRPPQESKGKWGC